MNYIILMFFFEANGLTKKYLFDKGGFTKLYEDRQREKIEQDRIELLNKQKLETEIDIIKFQKGLGKKLTIWGFIVAVISVLTSVLFSVNTNNSNQLENSKIDSLNIKIKNIEKELFELKKTKTNNHDSADLISVPTK
ncbi:hypothetical protein GFJ94_00810 [Flavobacterium sp. LMO8]|uniref:hypothetical protein n=1 Tax=Flavobacterium sp. LMO8 TaxID=2654244 RepID=UPI001290C793|nr:hypothetical protein [Flavobacterium sp. LMO8]MQP23602.1 hypothetical protein [Flavobacterium sp. LMO8]